MKNNRISKEFYGQSALILAPLLLGKYLCRNIEGEIKRYRITETEAYYGEADTACHAHKGKTERTKIMYEKGGAAYIYLCYGIHYLLNIVTGEEGFPEAVLIRGIEGYNGPGKLTKALSIDIHLAGENVVNSERLWLEDEKNTVVEFDSTPRIGIDYASTEYRNKPWRFVVKKFLEKK